MSTTSPRTSKKPTTVRLDGDQPPRPELRGHRGQTSSHDLGLALAIPEREVLVFDGDGSLLMNLGSLVTIAYAAPRNLHHFVFMNGVYEVNGEHPIPGEDKIDCAAMAAAADYRHIETFSQLQDFESGVANFLAQPGPALAVIKMAMAVMKIEAGKSYPRDYEYIHSALARKRFRQALQSN